MHPYLFLMKWKVNYNGGLIICHIRTEKFHMEIQNLKSYQTQVCQAGVPTVGIKQIGGRWSYEESNIHINYLELLAIFHGLKSFCRNCIESIQVQVKTDNTTAKCYINVMGGVKSPQCKRLSKYGSGVYTEIFGCLQLTFLDLKKKKNTSKESTEWKLDESVLHKIFDIWGKPDIDMLASRLNKQIDRYASWHPDPEAEIVDALSGQIEARPSRVYLDSTSVDYTELVSVNNGTDDRYTASSSHEGEPVAVIRHSEKSSAVQQDSVNGLSSIQQALEDINISKRATDIVKASWRSGTKKQYTTNVKKWFSYCDKRKINHFQTNLISVIDFLSELYENGRSYSAINTARSSLSAIGIIIDGFAIGSHPLVKIHEGCLQFTASQISVRQTWDI